MANKEILLIVDTETTIIQTVADFGAVVVDLSTATILEQTGVLLWDEFTSKELWYDKSVDDHEYWSRKNSKIRKKDYEGYIVAGWRTIGAQAWVNGWLIRMQEKYDPIVTAYNMGFDFAKCRNTKIDLGIFSERRCLWREGAKIAYPNDADYVDFCHARGYLTKAGAISTKADHVAHFLLQGNHDVYEKEPHTALEDARDYEFPVAMDLYKRGIIPWD